MMTQDIFQSHISSSVNFNYDGLSDTAIDQYHLNLFYSMVFYAYRENQQKLLLYLFSPISFRDSCLISDDFSYKYDDGQGMYLVDKNNIANITMKYELDTGAIIQVISCHQYNRSFHAFKSALSLPDVKDDIKKHTDCDYFFLSFLINPESYFLEYLILDMKIPLSYKIKEAIQDNDYVQDIFKLQLKQSLENNLASSLPGKKTKI